MVEAKTINVEYPNGCGGPVAATFVEPTKAVLVSDPMACLFADTDSELRKLPDYRDLVELEEMGPGEYRFVRVLKRARFRRFQYILSSNPENDAADIQPLLSKVEDLGGYWERVFGGVLTVWLPTGCTFDPTDDLNRCLGLLK